MRKFSIILILVLALMLALASCTNEDVEVPDGLQIVKISEPDGYQLFGPEGWTVANDGDIAATYIASSGVVKASLSFAKAQMPEGSLNEYFQSQKKLYAYEISVMGEPALALGNADGERYGVVYTFKYNETDYSSMQIFAKNAGDFYIFTYTAEGSPEDKDSYYQRYIELINLSAKSVKFTAKSSEKPAVGGDGGADGYRLASDKDIAGFELYLPNDYTVITSDAHVSAKISDNANIFVSKALDTGVSFFDYIKNRKNEIKKFAENVTDIKITIKNEYDAESEVFKGWSDTMNVMPECDGNLAFGNLNGNLVLSYEYKYDVAGTTYHVYQIMGIKEGAFNTALGAAGYVFTYTATEEEYQNNLDEIKDILQRIKF